MEKNLDLAVYTAEGEENHEEQRHKDYDAHWKRSRV